MVVRTSRVLGGRCVAIVGLRPPARWTSPFPSSERTAISVAAAAARRPLSCSNTLSYTAAALSRQHQPPCSRCWATIARTEQAPRLLLPHHQYHHRHQQQRQEEVHIFTATLCRRTMATAPLPQNDDNSDANNGKREQGEGSHAAAEIARCDVTRSTSKRGRTERRAGQVVTDEEASRVWTVPNMITMGRIFFCPVLAGLIVTSHHDLALAGLLMASMSDWLDGYIAREWNQKSILGGFLDPLADKIMVTTVALALGQQGIMPTPLVALMVGRDALLISGAMLYRYRTKSANDTFFDFESLDFKVKPTTLSKANTALQFGTLWLGLTHAVYNVPTESIFSGICAVTGAATVASGMDYLLDSGLKPKSRLGRRLMMERHRVRTRFRHEEAAMQERMRLGRERRRAKRANMKTNMKDTMQMSPVFIAGALRDRISRGRQRLRDTGSTGVRNRWIRGRATVQTMVAKQRAQMQERAANRTSRNDWRRGPKDP